MEKKVKKDLAEKEKPKIKPEPKKEIKKEVAKQPKKVENQDDGRLRLTAKRFSGAIGLHERKAAGFLYWAGKKFGVNHKLKTTEWQPLYKEYLTGNAQTGGK